MDEKTAIAIVITAVGMCGATPWTDYVQMTGVVSRVERVDRADIQVLLAV